VDRDAGRERKLARSLTVKSLSRTIAGLSIALTLVFGLACGGSSAPTGPPPDPAIAAAGTYNLKIIDGATVPTTLGFVWLTHDGTADMFAGTEVLRTDHSYTESWTLRLSYNPLCNCGGVVNQTNVVQTGHFEIVGTTITFNPDATHSINPDVQYSYVGGYDARAFCAGLGASVTVCPAYTGAVANGALTFTDGYFQVGLLGTAFNWAPSLMYQR
jgi:hypothetical protein